MHYGARILAAERYRVKTLTVRADAIIAVVKGAKALHAADRTLEAEPRHAVLFARGAQWDIVNDPRGRDCYEALVLAFADEHLHEVSTRHDLSAVPAVASAEVIVMDDELQDALLRTLPPRAPSAFADALARHRVLEVLLLLAARGHRFAPQADIAWPERVRRLVAQRPHADWRVEHLAQEFHLSESTLRRRLEQSGTTLAALVREVRLEIALGLLQTTTLPVGEVAQRCGWESHSRFSAAFLERWGVSPSVVRARAPGDAVPVERHAQEMTETG